MKKKLCRAFLCLCLFPVGTSLFAQNKFKIGLDAGYTYSIMHTNQSNLVDAKFSGRYGFGANLSGEYMIWKSLFVSTGVSFIQKTINMKEQAVGQAGIVIMMTTFRISFIDRRLYSEQPS